MVTQIIQMATSLIVARLVGPGVIGTLAYGLAFSSMFSFVSDLGAGTAHIKHVSSGENEPEYNATYLVIKFGLMSIYLLFTFGAFFYTKYFTETGFETNDQEIVVLVYIVIVLIGQFTAIYSTTWAGRTQQAKQDIPLFIQNLSYQLFKLILALLGFYAIGIAFGNLVAILISIPVYIYLGKDIKFSKTRKSLLLKYFKISFPVTIIGVCQIAISSFDKLYLKSQTDTIMLGNYSAALSLAAFMKVIESSVGMLMFPHISSLLVQKEYDKINDTITKYQRFSFAFILPLVIILSIFSSDVILLTFGNKFNYSSEIFSIIVFAFFVSSLTLPYGNILFGMGKFKESGIMWIVVALVFLVLTYVLVSKSVLDLGGFGISLALLIVNLLLLGICIALVKKYLKEKISTSEGVKIIFFAFLYFGVLLSLVSALNISSIYFTIIVSPFVYLFFVLSANKLKVINKSDLDSIKKILDISKMIAYIKTEVFNRDKTK